jgi:hypothetical protein
MQELTMEDSIRKLEKELRIPEGFIENLLNEDDWSFVIKGHSFIEAAVSYLLVTALDRPNLDEVFSLLELSNKRTGKMAFVKALDVLDADTRRFISAFSELRNKLVHDISQVSFSFPTYVAQMDGNQFAEFVKAFGYFAIGDTFERDGVSVGVGDFLRRDPKRGAWFSLNVCVGVIYLKKDIAVLKEMRRLQILSALNSLPT